MASYTRNTGAPTCATTTFIEQLLAPITEGNAADTKAFRKEILCDMLREWHKGMERVRFAEARQTIAHKAFNDSGERYVSDHTPCALACMATYAASRAAKEAQCLILAPTAKEMRWKKRYIKNRSNVPPEIVAAIALDEKRFGTGAGNA